MSPNQPYKIGPATNTGSAPSPQKKSAKSATRQLSDSLIMGQMTSSSTSNPKKKIRLASSSSQTVLRPFSSAEIQRPPTRAEELEHLAWLKLSESSLAFWDNDEDAVYDHY